MSSYPTQERMCFVLCDDIRREVGNKLSLIGVYGGLDVLISKQDDTDNLQSLSFFIQYPDGDGEFNVDIQVKSPTGDITFDETFGKVTLHEGKAAVLAFKIAPFKMKGLGEYQLEIIFDKKHIYTAHFQIDKVNDS